jgi:Outer membrane protein beta-barrel domain
MSPVAKALLLITIVTPTWCMLWPQDEGDDNPRGNTNLGMPISAPLNPTAKFVHLGLGMTVGAGYNFTRRHGVVGEFMWNNLFPTNNLLGPIRVALQNPNINAGGNLLAFTGNYRFELRGKAVGTYLITGGGWYYRNAHLSQPVTTGSSVTCTPTWLWFGFACENGTVTANQTLARSSSSAMGVNGGIGFTARVGDAPYRVYVESRYHWAPNKGVSTQLVSVTVGIRY